MTSDKHLSSNPDSITKAAIFIAITAILSRGIGFVREAIYANTFGLNQEFDIYLIGAAIPIIINSAIYYLAQNYFISGYHKINPDAHNEKQNFLNINFWMFTGFSVLITLILFIFHQSIINSYLWNSPIQIKNATSQVFLLFILSIPFNAAYSILASYMQAELKFKHPALAQLFLNVPIIIFVLFFSKELNIYSIPAGYLFGSVLQVFYLSYLSRFKYQFSAVIKSPKHQLITNFTLPLLIMIFIEVINQLHIIIDRYFINFVDTGGIASLNYASVLFSLPISIFSFALATVIFPVFSKYLNSKTPEKTEEYLNYAIRITAFFFVPIMFIFYFNGNFIIRLIFQYGSFTPEDTQVTYNVLRMYSISLVFYASYALINKMIYSAGLIKELLFISIVLIFIKTILNFLLVDILKQDGLALSSSLTYIFLSISCYFFINKKIKLQRKFILFSEILIFSIASFVAYFISYQIIELISAGELLKDSFQVLIFIFVYLISIRYLQIDRIKIL